MRDVVEILAEMIARKDADCTAKRPKRQGEPPNFRFFAAQAGRAAASGR
jgi:hypothetical protein